MQIQKSDPPKSVERGLVAEFTRDDIFAILHAYLKQKLPNYPVRFDNIEVSGDEEGKLVTLSVSGVEIIPLNWKNDTVQDKHE